MGIGRAVVMVFALLVAGCGAADEQATRGVDPDGRFSYELQEPAALLPPDVHDFDGIFITRALFRGLIDFDSDMSEPRNVVAQDISTDDHQTFTITLVPGWTFHDGEPITAQTFADTFDFATDPDHAFFQAGMFRDVVGTDEGGLHDGSGLSGVQALDELTLQIELKTPFQIWPLRLAYVPFMPLPTACRSDVEACREQPIGNGPYELAEPWQHDESITLNRWDDYPGADAARNGGVDIRLISDDTTALLEVEAGTLDVMTAIPGPEVDRLRDTFGDRYGERVASGYSSIQFNLHEDFSGPDNLALRQALSLAIDREAISATIAPLTEPADSLVSPIIAGSVSGTCTVCTHDPERALELWEEHGGLDRITLHTLGEGGGSDTAVAEAITNQWRDTFGVEVTLDVLAFGDALERAATGTADGPMMWGWFMDYPSPENYLAPNFTEGGSFNLTGYANPDVEQLMADAKVAPDIDAANALYADAERVILEDLPVTPLLTNKINWLHSASVRNINVDPTPVLRLEDVEVLQVEGG